MKQIINSKRENIPLKKGFKSRNPTDKNLAI